MLALQPMPTVPVRTYGSITTELSSEPASLVGLTTAISLQGSAGETDVYAASVEHVPEHTDTSPASADEPKHVSLSCVQCKTKTSNTCPDSIQSSAQSQALDTNTFPVHGVHLLPSEPNGTWYTQARIRLEGFNGASWTPGLILEQFAHNLDNTNLSRTIEKIAGDCKDSANDWLNKTLAGHDLVETHGRVQRFIPSICTSMPSFRSLEKALDSVTDIAQSIRICHSDTDLLAAQPIDKYGFALDIGRKAEHALLEQGICKPWQFTSQEYMDVRKDMHLSLMYTFTQTKQLHENISLHHAKPNWVPDRQKKAWHLELDIDHVAVEVGSSADRSLLELGSIDTGFEISELHACAPLVDLDRQDQPVEDDWQLLEI